MSAFFEGDVGCLVNDDVGFKELVVDGADCEGEESVKFTEENL